VLCVLPAAMACSLIQNADDILVGPGDAAVPAAEAATDASVDTFVEPPVDAREEDALEAVDPRWALWRMPSNTPTNYAEEAPGIVTDKVTGLRWQKAIGTTKSYVDAEAACSALDLGGKGWRLPTRIELVSLLTFGRGIIPAINQSVFPSTPATKQWTASTRESGGRYVVDFDTGAVGTAVGSELYHHRCVKAP
jgi:uncharacterized protein DUF1566